MGFFEKASDFTIDGATMNDIAGDHITNNNTTNDTRNNCDNTNETTVKDSYNNFSKKYVEGGNTLNNNNGGGSFYQATGVQNVYATPPVQRAERGMARGAIAAKPPGRANGAARLAAKAGARPRQAIDQRPHNPTYSLPLPPREVQPEYEASPPRFKSNNPFINASHQPRAASAPNLDTDDWHAQLSGAAEDDRDYEDVEVEDNAFRKRPLYNERSYSSHPSSRRTR